MEKNQELEQLQLQMKNLLKNIKATEEHISLLETLPTIKNYNAYLYDREKLQEEYEEKKIEYQELLEETCPHPLWYLISYEHKDDIILFERYTCQCLYCECCKVFQRKDFYKESVLFESNKQSESVSLNISYEVTREEFLELESEGYSLDEIREILYSKYTEKNEDLARNLKMKYIPKQGK